jgi:putative MFS transporter
VSSPGLTFHHPLAFWLGCGAITAGVLLHVPMFMHASHLGYRMAGMPMDAAMLTGMALIPVGLALAVYGLLPRRGGWRGPASPAPHFHVADGVPLNAAHWGLFAVMLAAVIVDVMKPATLGFVLPGMTSEYGITAQTSGTLALVALTGTTIGSVLWGIVADSSGRRAAIMLSALMFIGTAICGAMPAFGWNLAMCFLMGLSAGGLLPIAFTLMAECIPAVQRGWLLVALGGLGTAAGYLVASGAAALLEPVFSWRILWVMGLPTGLLLIFLNRFIPESPRFLADKGLNREARQVLARFSRLPETGQSLVEIDVPVPPETGRFRQLRRRPYLGVTLGLVATGVSWGLVNFGFLLWLPTNLRAQGLAEQANVIIAQSTLLALPGVGLVIWLYQKWSSIRTLVLFVALTGATLLLFCFIEGQGLMSVAALSFAIALMLVSASGVVAMLIPYAAEVYPVHLRGTGSGVVAASSKAGGILGALLGVFGFFNNVAVSALFIACTLFAAATLLMHHGIDTRGLRLEDVHAAMLRKAAKPKL